MFRPYSDDCAYQALYATITETGDAPQGAGGPSTPYTISVGDTFSGTVGTGGDRDWVAVTLTAGQSYDIDLRGLPSGAGSLSDPYLRLYDSAGRLIRENDDSGSLESHIDFTALTTGTFYVAAGGYSTSTGTYRLSVTEDIPAPPASIDDLADYLVSGFWTDNGLGAHRFDTSLGNQITVDLSGLTADGRQLARWAFEAWEAVADIEFVETPGSAQITFDDTDTNAAYADYTATGGFTDSAIVNVGTGWLATYGTDMGSYSFQTYIHEIGHALGLGHQGDYNGAATYGVDETFANDSWQLSVMSYFSQTSNTSVTASQAELVTAMMADIVAIQSMYGAAGSGSLTDGDTVYGVGDNLGLSWLGRLFSAMDGSGPATDYDGGPVAMTLYDAGGRDTVDFSDDTADQAVDLRGEGIWDVYGLTGNVTIARDTVIEIYHAGSGDDRVQGNAADNRLFGNAGNDRLTGGGGADAFFGGQGRDTVSYEDGAGWIRADLTDPGSNSGDAAGDRFTSIENLIGGSGNDSLFGMAGRNRLDGGAGRDTLVGRDGNDVLRGNTGNDTLLGGAGSDTLSGGAGNDMLRGGAARDTFIFNAGQDVIADFNQDYLRLDDGLWGGAVLSNAQILAFASVTDGDTLFDFGGGHMLTLEDFTDIAALDPLLMIY